MKTIDIEKLKTDKTIARSIERANRTFIKATSAQKRVLIAKDALEQISKRRFHAMHGTYLETTASDYISLSGEAISFQRMLHNSRVPDCIGCARGSLFVSAVRFRNACKVDWTGLDASPGRFRDLKEFSPAQLDMIEDAFEG